MERELLEKPFEANLTKTRRGHSGKVFSYVEGTEYIRRLNEAFDGRWSFEVTEYQILEHEVIVLGRLTAEDITKVAFGGASITRHHQTKEALNIADDLKAAATDALKKASTLLGLGLHLHAENTHSPAAGTALVTKLTERQLSAILAIARGLGWSRETLNKYSEEKFGAHPQILNKTDASSLIDELRQIAVKDAA